MLLVRAIVMISSQYDQEFAPALAHRRMTGSPYPVCSKELKHEALSGYPKITTYKCLVITRISFVDILAFR